MWIWPNLHIYLHNYGLGYDYCAAIVWPCTGVAWTSQVSHVGVVPNYKINYFSSIWKPHISLTQYLQRPHDGLTGRRRILGFSQPQWGKGCVVAAYHEEAFMRLHQSMWLSCSQCEAFVRRHVTPLLMSRTWCLWPCVTTLLAVVLSSTVDFPGLIWTGPNLPASVEVKWFHQISLVSSLSRVLLYLYQVRSIQDNTSICHDSVDTEWDDLHRCTYTSRRVRYPAVVSNTSVILCLSHDNKWF